MAKSTKIPRFTQPKNRMWPYYADKDKMTRDDFNRLVSAYYLDSGMSDGPYYAASSEFELIMTPGYVPDTRTPPLLRIGSDSGSTSSVYQGQGASLRTMWMRDSLLPAGSYTLSEIRGLLAFATSNELDTLKAVAVRDNGNGTWTKLAEETIALSSPITGAKWYENTTSMSFTVGSGEDVYLGYESLRNAAATTFSVKKTAQITTQTPARKLDFTLGGEVTGTFTPDTETDVTQYQVSFEVQGASEKKLHMIQTPVADANWFPSSMDRHYGIALRRVIVPNGSTLTINVQDDYGSAHVAASVVIDFNGGGTSGLGSITAGGNEVDLNQTVSEAGNVFDMMILWRGVNEWDLFYMNRSVGQHDDSGSPRIVTFSHSTKATGSRTSPYANQHTSVTAATNVSLSTSTMVDYIEVGYDFVVILGDSQAINSSARLGGNLPNAFSPERYAWQMASSGDTATDAVERWKNTTIGDGEAYLISDSVHCWAGIGINGMGDPETRIPLNVTALESFVATVKAEGYESLVIGVPPCRDSGIPSGWPENLNEYLRALGLEYNQVCQPEDVLCYNPWNLVLPNIETYMDSASVHYVDAGAVAVSDAAAEFYEDRLLPGWWQV